MSEVQIKFSGPIYPNYNTLAGAITEISAASNIIVYELEA
jgi:hypothetical protein